MSKAQKWSLRAALLIALGAMISGDAPLRTNSTLAQTNSNLTAAGTGTQTNTAKVVIFNATISAKPGDVIGLQGHFSSSAQVWMSVVGTKTKILLPAINQRTGYVTARIPTNQPFALYSLQVYDQKIYSKPVYINKAIGMSFDTPEVAPSNTFRIFGRNLLLPGAKPTVRFINTSTGASSNATVTEAGSDAYVLKVMAPSNLTPGEYRVYISNGYGGTSGETKISRNLQGRSSGIDFFQLGVPWGADYSFYANTYNLKTDSRLSEHAVGDGIHNDQPAIQKAIDTANAAGGGVVYLPKGTYKLGSSLIMKSRVVLQGVDKDSTTIKFGFGTVPGSYVIWWPNGTTVAGIADLTIQNVNESGKWYDNMANGKDTSKLFMQRIRFDLNSGDGIYWTGTTKMVVANSTFIQAPNSRHRGPWVFNNSSDFVIRSNTSIQSAGGYAINYVRDGVIESNHFIRDGAHNLRETRGLNLNFTTDIALLNNTFDVINGPAPDDYNDGETILSEGGGSQRENEDIGTVTGATSQTLEDTSKTFSALSSRLRAVVVIVNGVGAGQWRNVIDATANTLTVDRPWDIAPTAGSHYALMSWSAANWLIKGNTLKNNPRGITLYEASSRDIAIVGNQLINNNAIYLHPVQRTLEKRFNVVYNTQITNNTLTNTDGRRPAFIGIRSAQVSSDTVFGIGTLGVEVRDNSITAHTPNTQEPPYTERSTECYYNDLMYQYPSKYKEEGVPAILGTIFQNNKATNCNNVYYLNSGSYNTVLWNTLLDKVGNLKQDERINGATSSSISTVINP